MADRSPDWTDPAYVAAKNERAMAYAEFCRVAGANPYRYGQDGFFHYYIAITMPAKLRFVEAHNAYRTQVQRVLANLGREPVHSAGNSNGVHHVNPGRTGLHPSV